MDNILEKITQSTKKLTERRSSALNKSTDHMIDYKSNQNIKKNNYNALESDVTERK